MSTMDAPSLAVKRRQESEAARVLQPSGWPMPKGYANGMAAEGRIVVTGGVIGWDEQERLADGLCRAGAPDPVQHRRDPRRRRARGRSIWCA